ncbi:GNAT family N-acetyltransferase [Candidatus Bathyarchaeota archaeon]|nr:GNAT family N-acetyltransferase [Candidatus Bathyarchaeota archaeon]
MADDFDLVRVMKGDEELASAFLEMGEDYMGSEPPELRGRFLRSVVDLQVEEERWLYLLRVDAGFIGFVHMKVDTTDRPGWGWMMEFYIRPEHRRRGRGRRLYERSERILVNRGVKDIWLTSNPEAIPFWRAVGFAETGEKVEFNDYSVMVKSV